MKFRSHSHLASGLPMDWHERPSIGSRRGRQIVAPRFLAGMMLGIALGILIALLVARI